jgi:hypothetical protein
MTRILRITPITRIVFTCGRKGLPQIARICTDCLMFLPAAERSLPQRHRNTEKILPAADGFATDYTDLHGFLFASQISFCHRGTENTEEIQITFQCFCGSVANSFLPQAELIRANLCNTWL